ncbi:MAG: hypothetical protein AAB773_02525 [Patescibacteria group bacterium]
MKSQTAIKPQTAMKPDTILTNENAKASQGGNKLTVTVIALLIIASAAAAFFYNQVSTLEQDPNKANEAKIALLVEKVGKLIALPEGELPVVATVSDTAPLANNPFFAKAKVGDEVLLYTAARKAFLYDPKANIIVEVASLNIGQ